MKKISDQIKMGLMVVIAGTVLLVLMIIAKSACAVSFCQPKEPAVLYDNFLKKVR